MAKIFNNFKKNIGKWLTVLFCFYWLFIVLIDFIANSPDYVYAVRFFKYWDFLVAAYITGFICSIFFIKKKSSWNTLNISGFRIIYFYPVLLAFMTMAIGFYFYKNNLDFSVSQFLIKTVLIHTNVLIVIVASISSGAFLLKYFKLPVHFNSNLFLQICIGFAIMCLGIFILAVINQFNWFTASIWLFILIITGWRSLFDSLKNNLWKKQQDITVKPFSVFLIITAIILISVNLITVTSPFPIGFDSLTLYMNIPKLVTNYGGLIEGIYPYNWSLIVSLGYVVFESNAVALHLGSVSGILLIFLIFKLARKYVSIDWAIFSAVLFYTLPIVVWPSSIEIKTDLSVFLIMLTVIYIIIDYYFGYQNNQVENNTNNFFNNESKIWLIAGILTGFSLGIKYTSLIAVLGLVVFLFHFYYGKLVAFASILTIVIFILIFNLYSFADLSFTKIEIFSLSLLMALLAIFFTFLARKKGNISTQKPLKLIFILMIGAGVALLPWGIKKTAESNSLNVSELLKNSESITAKFNFDLDQIARYELFSPILTQVLNKTDETKNNIENNPENYTAKKEEIKRYLGYEGGFMRFLSLPYDLTNKSNVDLFSTDISYLFLAFFPLILFRYKRARLLPVLIRILLLTVWCSLCFWSVHNPDNSLSMLEVQETLLNKNYGFGSEFSYHFSSLYTTLIYPFLLLGSFLTPLYTAISFDNDIASIVGILVFSVMCYFLFKNVLLKDLDLKSKSLLLFVATYFLFWLILSSGIPWYGIIGFGLLPLVLAVFLFTNQNSVFQNSQIINGVSFSFIFIWIFILLIFRISPLIMGKTQNPESTDFSTIFLKSSALFASGQITEVKAFNTEFNYETRKIIRELNENKNTKILNIATLFAYFIEENDKRMYNDNQLDYFSALWTNSENNKITTTHGLKQRGFNYILVDLEAHTLDMTPDQTLVKKMIELFNYLNENPYVELIATDRLLVHPDGDKQIIFNGNTLKVKNDVFGYEIIEKGKTALFKINF